MSYFLHSIFYRWNKGLFILVVIFVFAPQFAFAQPMGIKDLVEFGLKNSPSMLSSELKLQSKELSRKNALSQFFPSLDIKAIHGYKDGEPLGEDNPRAGKIYLTLTENLYDNGVNITAYEIARLEQKKSEIEFLRDRGEFCLKVLREFNFYSQAFELLKVQEFQYNILLKQFKSIEGKYKRGEKTRTEYLRFKAQLQRSNLSLTDAQNTLNKSAEDLKALIGYKEEVLQLLPEPRINNQLNEIPEYSLGLEKHYEYQISEYEKQLSEKNLSLVKRKYYPEISMTAGLSYSNFDYLASGSALEDNGQTDWSALVTLKYNLLDWGIRERDVAIAKIERNTINYTISQRLLTLRANIAKLVLDLKQLKNNYKLNSELVELELSNYKSIVLDYHNGRATFLDLVDSVDNLTRAQNLFLRNYYEFSTLLAEYKFHQGKLYESIVKQ